MNFIISSTARQSHRAPWPFPRLVRERAINMSFAKEKVTKNGYSSGFQSYLYFCYSHKIPVDPTPDTLSLYVAWLAAHIKPASVDTYLSGICSELEDYYPDVRKNRRSPLVRDTLAGAKRRFRQDTTRKEPLTIDDLIRVASTFTEPSHDERLFLALVLCGFFGVHRLGELVDHDSPRLRDHTKTIQRASVKDYANGEGISYWLPKHKADQIAGSEVIIRRFDDSLDPVPIVRQYLDSRDKKFPLHSQLFLTSEGRVPTRSWYMRRFKQHFAASQGGHSGRSGAATFLALLGWSKELIQKLGRWKSDAFDAYVRKNPVVLQAFRSAGRLFMPTGPINVVNSTT